MKKPMLYCFIALMITSGIAWPTAAADGVLTSPLSAMDLNAMPLVSRSLAEFASDSAADSTLGSSDSEYAYSAKKDGPGWLFASLVEPFYLTLLGAGLLLFGTFRGRKDF